MLADYEDFSLSTGSIPSWSHLGDAFGPFNGKLGGYFHDHCLGIGGVAKIIVENMDLMWDK